MADPRPILYGVSDYSEIRKANAWFVDRTAKIRDLEKVRYAIFLRPRRFGKSLLCAILEAYYDVRYADRFEDLFGGTAIGANPTDERNKYFVLRFDFSAVSKDVSNVQEDFDYKASLQCDTFANKYREELGEKLVGEILSAPDCGKKLAHIIAGLKGTKNKLYVIIDEYDNFTNTILAESGLDAYGRLCHGEGFFKQFFAELKAATSGIDAALPRLFITGVSPVTMDDVTSGFNIGTNISLDPVFADLTGFRHDDLGAIAKYYGNACGFDAAKAEAVCLEWFDNYRFGAFDAPQVANTTLVLSFFDKLVRAKVWPDNYIAGFLADYSNIRNLLANCKHPDRIKPYLQRIIQTGTITSPLTFLNSDIRDAFDLVKWLYYEGLLSMVGKRFGNIIFEIPNKFAKSILDTFNIG